jgi:hypothetical protein
VRWDAPFLHLPPLAKEQMVIMRTIICALLTSVSMAAHGQTETFFTNRDGSVYSVMLTLGDSMNNNSPTNLSFTDLTGRSYSNAIVTATNPSSITLKWGDASGAKVDLTNAPENIRSMFHYDAANADAFTENEQIKKRQRIVGYTIASIRTATEQARQAEINQVKATAHDVIGEVFQVTSGGALVNLFSGLTERGADAFMAGQLKSDYTWEKTLVFLTNYGSLLVDGERLRMTTYPIGNYTYDSVNGSGKTVLKITPNLQTALEWNRQLSSQDFSNPSSPSPIFSDTKDGVPFDVYDKIAAKAEKEYPDSYSMQVNVIKWEIEAYNKLHP